MYRHLRTSLHFTSPKYRIWLCIMYVCIIYSYCNLFAPHLTVCVYVHVYVHIHLYISMYVYIYTSTVYACVQICAFPFNCIYIVHCREVARAQKYLSIGVIHRVHTSDKDGQSVQYVLLERYKMPDIKIPF